MNALITCVCLCHRALSSNDQRCWLAPGPVHPHCRTLLASSLPSREGLAALEDTWSLLLLISYGGLCHSGAMRRCIGDCWCKTVIVKIDVHESRSTAFFVETYAYENSMQRLALSFNTTASFVVDGAHRTEDAAWGGPDTPSTPFTNQHEFLRTSRQRRRGSSLW